MVQFGALLRDIGTPVFQHQGSKIGGWARFMQQRVARKLNPCAIAIEHPPKVANMGCKSE
ncbi:MAG: hypothetical protein ABI866_06370 [Dokdonella sp.]